MTSPTLRIAVLLSGSGTSLENLLEHIDSGAVPGRVEIVIASKEKAFGLERARRRGIPAVLAPSSGRKRGAAPRAAWKGRRAQPSRPDRLTHSPSRRSPSGARVAVILES